MLHGQITRGSIAGMAITAPRQRTAAPEKPASNRRSSDGAQRAAILFATMMSVLMAGEITEVMAQEKEKAKAKDTPAGSLYDKMKTHHKKLKNEVYVERAKAMKELEKLLDADLVLYLSSLQKTGDLETDRRLEELVAKGLPLLDEAYGAKPKAEEWIDGPRFHPNKEKAQKFRLPPIFPNAENMCVDDVINYYLHVAAGRGAASDGSPKWTNYQVGMQAFLEDWTKWTVRQKLQSLKNPETQKEVDAWLAKNPGKDRGECLKEIFRQRMEVFTKERDEVQEWFIEGSEKYRENNKLPSKRAPKGPDLRFDHEQSQFQDPADHTWTSQGNGIAMMSAEKTRETRTVLELYGK